MDPKLTMRKSGPLSPLFKTVAANSGTNLGPLPFRFYARNGVENAIKKSHRKNGVPQSNESEYVLATMCLKVKLTV